MGIRVLVIFLDNFITSFARDESSFTDQLSSDHIHCHDFILSLLPRGGGGGYSHILAIQVCATREGMVFKPFGLV